MYFPNIIYTAHNWIKNCFRLQLFFLIVGVSVFTNSSFAQHAENSNFSGRKSLITLPRLNYPARVMCIINDSITPILPSRIADTILSCTISPALPQGLSISSSGVISGRPTVLTNALSSPNTIRNFTITATNNCGSSTATLFLVVVPGPLMVYQPIVILDTICIGGIQNISVLAKRQEPAAEINGGVLSYQWRKNGIPIKNGIDGQTMIGGAQSQVLTLSNVGVGYSGAFFDVIISDSNYTYQLVAVKNTVKTSFIVVRPPAIINQPVAPSKACERESVKRISVSATGDSLQYQWRKNYINLINDAVFSGAKTPTLTITNPAATDSGYYDVVVFNRYNCGVTSSRVFFKVGYSRISGVFNTIDTVRCEGTGEVKLSVPVLGNDLKFSWLKFPRTIPGSLQDGFDPYSGSTISGATTSSLTITNPYFADQGFYTLSVNSDGCLGTTATSGKLSVIQKPVITNDISVYSVSSPFQGIGLKVKAKAADASTMRLTWRKNGIPIPDSLLRAGTLYKLKLLFPYYYASDYNETFLEIKQASYDITEGMYDVVVSNDGCGKDTSTAYNIEFPRIPTNITVQPAAPEYNCPTADIVLNVAATGVNLSYQWRRNSVPITTGGSKFVLSNDGKTLTIKPQEITQNPIGFATDYSSCEGMYDAVIGGADGDVKSFKVNIKINKDPVVDTITPSGAFLCLKSTNVLFGRAISSVGDSIRYQWLDQYGDAIVNNSIFSGATSQVLSFTNAPYASRYTLATTNSCGITKRSIVSPNFNDERRDSIENTIAQPTRVCNGVTDQHLRAFPISNPNFTYSWRKDGVALKDSGVISGVASYDLRLNKPGFSDNGVYDLLLTYKNNTACSISTNTITLRVDSTSQIISQPVAPAPVLSESGVQRMSVLAEGKNLEYTWVESNGTAVVNNAIISGQGTSTLTLTNPKYVDNFYGYRVFVSGTCLLGENDNHYINSQRKIGVMCNTITPKIVRPLVFVRQPVSPGSVCTGNASSDINASFSILVSGTDMKVNYQWRKNGIPIKDGQFSGGRFIAGAKTEALQIYKPNQSDSGSYDVLVSGIYGSDGAVVSQSMLSAIAKLTVTPQVKTKTTITAVGNYTWPVNGQRFVQTGIYVYNTTCQLDSLDLTITPIPEGLTRASICNGESYTWPVNNQQYTQAGTYSYEQGDNTVNLQLTVKERPRAFISGSKAVCSGTSTPLLISLSGGSASFTSGTLSDGTAFDSKGNVAIIPVSPASTTTYTVATLSDGCDAIPADLTGSAGVTVRQRPTVTLTGTSWNCEGDTKQPTQLNMAFTGTGPWQGFFSDGTPYYAATSPYTISVPYPTFSGATQEKVYKISSVYDVGSQCNVMAADLTGTVVIKAKTIISYENPYYGTAAFYANAEKSQTICLTNHDSIHSIIYSTKGKDSLEVSGLPTGVTSQFFRNYTYINSNNQQIPIENALVINGTPSQSGIYQYMVSSIGGCSSVKDSGTIAVLGNNTMVLSSAVATDAQTVFQRNPIVPITYATTSATGAIVTGLPAGVTGSWLNNTLTISGESEVAGSFNYTATLTGGCGSLTSLSGNLIVNPINTITLSSNPGSDGAGTCLDFPISPIVYTTTGATGVTVTGLPDGVSANWADNVLTINGTPNQLGLFNYRVNLSGGSESGSVPTFATGSILVAANLQMTLMSAVGTDTQSVKNRRAIIPIQYRITGVSNAYATGLPGGIISSWANNVLTISGTINGVSTLYYSIHYEGGCSNNDSIGNVGYITSLEDPITVTGNQYPIVCYNSPIETITFSEYGAVNASVLNLPAGVNAVWDNNKLTISGAPTNVGFHAYTVLMEGPWGIDTAYGRIIVKKDKLIIQGIEDLQNCINVSLTNQIPVYIQGDGSTASISDLPPGISGTWVNDVSYGNGSYFALTGTPTLAGDFQYKIVTLDGCAGEVATGIMNVKQGSIPVLVSHDSTIAQHVFKNYLPISTINYRFSTRYTGADSVEYGHGWGNQMYFDSLPRGLKIVRTDSTLSIMGVARDTGTFNYRITLQGECINREITGTIRVAQLVPTAQLISEPSNFLNLCPFVPMTPIVYETTYADTASVGIFSSRLPAGLTYQMEKIDSIHSRFTISGTPTEAGQISTYIRFSVKGFDLGYAQIVRNFYVYPAPEVSLTSPQGTDAQTICVNTPIAEIKYLSTTNTANGGILWNFHNLLDTEPMITGLPPGVTLDLYTSAITGTPTASGIFNYTIRLVDPSNEGGCNTTRFVHGSITVKPQPDLSINAAATTVCTGQSIGLTASGANSYLWNNGAVLPTVNITPTATAFYRITGTNSDGCSSIDSVLILVKNNQISSPDTSICAGNSVTFSSTADAPPNLIRFVKFEVTDISPDPLAGWFQQAQLAEMVVYKNGVNIALNKPGYASSYAEVSVDPDCFGCFEPGTWNNSGKFVVDGQNSGMSWNSNWVNQITPEAPQYIVVDLETANTIDSVRIYTPSFWYKQPFRVQVSENGTDWTSIGNETNSSFANNPVDIHTYYPGEKTPTYLWSTGETTDQITVAPSATTRYYCTINGASGCTDSLLVTVSHPMADAVTTATACEYYLWAANGLRYTTSGQYTAVTACGTYALDLTIKNSQIISVDTTICSGNTVNLSAVGGIADNNTVPYLWSTGETTPQITVAPSMTTRYYCTINGASGCTDSVMVTVNHPVAEPLITTTACSNYQWAANNQVYSESGHYTVVTVCGTYTLNLTIKQPSSSIEIISSCAPITWHGNPYAASTNSATWTGVNAAGCDSVVTLNLTIKQPTFSTEIINTVDSFSWHGTTYFESTNSATWTGVNATGCDSVVTLDLTFRVKPIFTQRADFCGYYLAPSDLPATSNNNISGTWSDNYYETVYRSDGQTSQYIFTPNNAAHDTASMYVNINYPILPHFTPVDPICSGASISALPTTSIEGIHGSWSPAINNAVTTTYTFTPDVGMCAISTTMIVAAFPTLTASSTCLTDHPVLQLNGSYSATQIQWVLNTDTIVTTNGNFGTTVAGGAYGTGANQLSFPNGVFVDSLGNVFVSDEMNSRIQKWVPGATEGVTIAGGNGDGSAANQFYNQNGLYVDALGNVFVSDTYNNRIQKWTPGALEGITVAGGNRFGGSAANQLRYPNGVSVDAMGNVYVSDTYNNRIQKWAPDATEGVTVAGGNRYGSAANQLANPSGVFVDASGNVYVSDAENHRVQKWTPGAIEGVTVAGGNNMGSASNQLKYPTGVYVDLAGNVYVSDRDNNRIQKWLPGASAGVTIAGGNGFGSSPIHFLLPNGVYVDGSGNVFVSDKNNNRIQKWGPPMATTRTASTAGTYKVFVTNSTGCRVQATGTIIVAAENNTIALTSAVGTNAQTNSINTAITNITYASTGATGAIFSGLPTGVTGSWANNIATISGNASETGAFNYTVTMTGGCTAGTNAVTGTITVGASNNTIVLSSGVGTNAQTRCINTAITDITYSTTGATGATFSGLPIGVTGIWANDLITISGTPTVAGVQQTYTITLTGGNESVSAFGTITVNAAVIPSFTRATVICSGAILEPLPTTSDNGIAGTWSPELNNISTTTYIFSPTAGQCATTSSMTIVVNTSTTPTTVVTACDSYIWAANGQTYTQSGTYYGTAVDCVTPKLVLTITASTNATTTITACDSYKWSANGETYTQSGTYYGTAVDCVTPKLVLTITASTNATTTITACDSYKWLANGETYTQSGTYYGTAVDCVTPKLVLTITASTNATTTITACDSYKWLANGETYTQSGTYYGIAVDCVTPKLVLTITASTNATTTITACDSYKWLANGETYTQSGTYYGTAVDCVTPKLVLTITASTNATTTITACDSYKWLANGETYTQSGTYYGTAVDCVTPKLVLTITASANATTTITACDSYKWLANGETYTQSGTYYGMPLNCVTPKLVLTIKASTNATTTITACDSYKWLANGETYTQSGTYYGTPLNCVTPKLVLTITAGTKSVTSISACTSYKWAATGTTYTTSGVYIWTGTNAANCDSVVTLNLTIKQPTSSSIAVSACDSYAWKGTTYTTSGAKTWTVTNAVGCDSVVTLNLTITASTSNATTISACESYTWPVNGITYSASGTYTSVSGCHTETLNLTILAAPAAPVTVGGASCGTGTVSLSATAGAGIGLAWYSSPVSTTLVSTAAVFTTPTLSANTTYYVAATRSGCSSARTAVGAVINALPDMPAATNGTVCGSGVVTLGATPGAGNTIDWYSAATNGTLLSGGSAGFSTPSLGASTTYYAQARNTTTGCVSARTVVTATLLPLPAEAGVSGATLCGSGAVTLTATVAAGMAADWYSAAVGGSLLQSGASSYTTGVLTETTTFYVQSKNTTTGCLSATRTAVKGTINITPAPAVTGGSNCGAGTVTLSAVAPSGTTLAWFAVASGGTGLGTAASYTTPSLTTSTTYYVEARNSTCISARAAVTATILPVLASPTVTGASRCGSGSVTLGAATSVTGASLQWLSTASSTAVLGTGTSFTSEVLTATKTYYVVATTGATCRSAAVAVTATVNLPLAAPGSLTGTTSICSVVGTTTLTSYTALAVRNAVSYKWTLPAGAVVDGSATGNIIKLKFNSAAPSANLGVQAIASNGCEGNKKEITLTGCTAAPLITSIQPAVMSIALDSVALQVQLFPNPSQSFFRLRVQSASRELLHLRVLDLAGREIKQWTANPASTITFGRDLKPGAYFVELLQGKTRRMLKAVKL